MKKVFSIFCTDLKSLSKNLIIFVVIIGITILPALYAWFNIASNWDPYSGTGGLPFAVGTLDKGAGYKSVKVKAATKSLTALSRTIRWAGCSLMTQTRLRTASPTVNTTPPL